jgi:acetyl-CoA synthetase
MAVEKTMDVFQPEGKTFPASPEFSKGAHIQSRKEYDALYRRSIQDPESFWSEQAETMLSWYGKWSKTLEYSFEKPNIKWFIGGTLNASYNCLDRHLADWRKNKAAIIWEGDDGSYRTFTYQQLYYEVNRFANVLKKKGIRRGDRVSIYLPMIPEIAISMLACARIGAIHSVVFGGFSAQALRNCIQDCGAEFLVTADKSVRGGKYDDCAADMEVHPSESGSVVLHYS